MATSTRAAPIDTRGDRVPAGFGEARSRSRRRALLATAGITLGSLALLADLFLAGHTVGEEIWGPITAATGTAVGLLSLTFLAMGSRRRVARLVLYALWALVGFFGLGGYNDHRLPQPADTVADQRERPPLAPLAFTGLAIAGAVALRSGSKGA
jgi:hypothetical protein